MDTGANIHSSVTKVIDTQKDLSLEDGEWESMDDEEKYKLTEEWCWQNGLQIGYTEI